MANPVPEGTHTLTPHLVVKGAAKAKRCQGERCAATISPVHRRQLLLCIPSNEAAVI